MSRVNTPLPITEWRSVQRVNTLSHPVPAASLQAMQYYTDQGAVDPLTDSDGDEFNKPEDGEGKQQYMFIWSPKYEVGKI